MNIVAFLFHRPIPLLETPRLSSQDVTVVIPSLGADGLQDTLRSILATEPCRVILVTIDANVEKARKMVKQLQASKVQVLSIAQPNKRRQMVQAIPEIMTDITVFADDDVTWPPRLLDWMLAPLEQEQFGGVGTNQALRRAENPTVAERLWGFLGAVYLQRRNFDCAACNFVDGGLPCLSGRTVAYRTKIIKDDAFRQGFTNEMWGWGQTYQLNADDDNFITRWLVSHGHKIAFQYHKEAEVLTELESNSKFLKQCLRWSRSNWRSNITSMCVEGHIWRYVSVKPSRRQSLNYIKRTTLESLRSVPDDLSPLGDRLGLGVVVLPSQGLPRALALRRQLGCQQDPQTFSTFPPRTPLRHFRSALRSLWVLSRRNKALCGFDATRSKFHPSIAMHVSCEATASSRFETHRKHGLADRLGGRPRGEVVKVLMSTTPTA